ncbi:MAG TPA: hypothetical protein VHD38_00615, partial [Candidatus Paceibacterota bacterium]|nr:hypothetical protein [Candidatus Paceibacterota bacterium]
MQRHRHTFAIAAVLIIAACFAYLAVVHNRQVGSQSGVLPNQQYVSTAYGFSFEYPPQYRLNEYTDRSIELQDAQSGSGLVSIEVELADPIVSPKNYEDFAYDSARNT